MLPKGGSVSNKSEEMKPVLHQIRTKSAGPESAGGCLGMRSRTIVPRPLNTDDSPFCERTASVPGTYRSVRVWEPLHQARDTKKFRGQLLTPSSMRQGHPDDVGCAQSNKIRLVSVRQASPLSDSIGRRLAERLHRNLAGRTRAFGARRICRGKQGYGNQVHHQPIDSATRPQEGRPKRDCFPVSAHSETT